MNVSCGKRTSTRKTISLKKSTNVAPRETETEKDKKTQPTRNATNEENNDEVSLITKKRRGRVVTSRLEIKDLRA